MVAHNRIGHDINGKDARQRFEPILDELFPMVVTGPRQRIDPTKKRPPHTPTEHVQHSDLIISNDLTPIRPRHHGISHQFGRK